jgi:large subunit ribosomal protein LP0
LITPYHVLRFTDNLALSPLFLLQAKAYLADPSAFAAAAPAATEAAAESAPAAAQEEKKEEEAEESDDDMGFGLFD